MAGTSPLPVTERTRHRRLREQGSTDRGDLEDILAAGVICHLGVVVDGYPMVVPTVTGGPGGRTLYLHGSVASRSLVCAPQAPICVTVTHLDGLGCPVGVRARGQLPQRDDLRHAQAGDATRRRSWPGCAPSPSTSCQVNGTTPAAPTEGTGPEPPCFGPVPGRGLGEDPHRAARRRRRSRPRPWRSGPRSCRSPPAWQAPPPPPPPPSPPPSPPRSAPSSRRPRSARWSARSRTRASGDGPSVSSARSPPAAAPSG